VTTIRTPDGPELAPTTRPPDGALTETEASAYLRLSRAQLLKMRTAGTIPYVLIGRAVRYPLAALDAWLAELTQRGDAS
jgi:excisionase family DNA binding protein